MSNKQRGGSNEQGGGSSRKSDNDREGEKKKEGESKTKKGVKRGKDKKNIYNNFFFTFIFYINYINSRFKKYDLARFQLIPSRNQF